MNDGLTDSVDDLLFPSGHYPGMDFDPFELRGDESGGQASQSDLRTDESGSGHYTEPEYRYDRASDQSIAGFQPDDAGPVPWQGARAQSVTGAAERDAREAAHTGDRNVRRTAEQRTGGIGEGGSGTGPGDHEPAVANSIGDAAERLRRKLCEDLRETIAADAGIPLDADRRSAKVLELAEHPNIKPPKREYNKQHITTPPQFETTSFEATIAGLKANVNGEWILTLKVSADSRQRVYALDDAFGLALKVSIDRRRFSLESDAE